MKSKFWRIVGEVLIIFRDGAGSWTQYIRRALQNHVTGHTNVLHMFSKMFGYGWAGTVWRWFFFS
jgi:hypothetical protein